MIYINAREHDLLLTGRSEFSDLRETFHIPREHDLLLTGRPVLSDLRETFHIPIYDSIINFS
jgi:hypothetical protein